MHCSTRSFQESTACHPCSPVLFVTPVLLARNALLKTKILHSVYGGQHMSLLKFSLLFITKSACMSICSLAEENHYLFIGRKAFEESCAFLWWFLTSSIEERTRSWARVGKFMRCSWVWLIPTFLNNYDDSVHFEHNSCGVGMGSQIGEIQGRCPELEGKLLDYLCKIRCDPNLTYAWELNSINWFTIVLIQFGRIMFKSASHHSLCLVMILGDWALL